MIEAVLFDMDGVLVDSEELIFKAAKKMFAGHGIQVTQDDFKPFIGTGEDSYLGNVAKKYKVPFNLDRDKFITYTLYDELAKEALKILPGVREFILKCKKMGLKLAVATSADEMKMLINLRELNLADGTFDATVNGLEVENKKPHPEIYLLAADKLGIEPKNCLVVEDAVTGIEAGKLAGCKTLGLTTSFTEKDLHDADWICENLSNVPDETLTW